MLSTCYRCSRGVSWAYLLRPGTFATATAPQIRLISGKTSPNFRFIGSYHGSNYEEGYQENYFGGRIPLGGGLSGFCVGILGFFEKKEKLSPEDELLLKIKRGILAMQVA